MNINRLLEAMPRTICLQPDCVLRRPDLDNEYLAEILVQVIAGGPMEEFIGESERITALDQCRPCAMRVLLGGKAYLIQAEWDHLDGLGQWHRRRQWRRIRSAA